MHAVQAIWFEGREFRTGDIVHTVPMTLAQTAEVCLLFGCLSLLLNEQTPELLKCSYCAFKENHGEGEEDDDEIPSFGTDEGPLSTGTLTEVSNVYIVCWRLWGNGVVIFCFQTVLFLVKLLSVQLNRSPGVNFYSLS